MSSQFQNLKNFIRHARHANDPPAQQQQQQQQQQRHAFTDPPPVVHDHTPKQRHDHSTAAGNNKNVAAKAAGQAAQVQGQCQHMEDVVSTGIAGTGVKSTQKNIDSESLARIIAEEKTARERLPMYPGLDRWALLAKMGDGAFSNVYKARDTHGIYGEVAIKVVRKYELNASQVCINPCASLCRFFACFLWVFCNVLCMGTLLTSAGFLC
jgi:hypothetical protein